MKTIFIVFLSVFFIACASKNTKDSLFDGNLVPVNSEEIKQNLGENNG